MPKNFFIEIPPGFSFANTLISHGWSRLAPFTLETGAARRLTYVFTGGETSVPFRAAIEEDDGRLKITAPEATAAADGAKLLRDVRHILRLDDDLTEFYALVKREKSLAWVAEVNAGRLLRSPTVYEDLVKTICTTNCSWAMTEKMVTNLVENLGAAAADGARAFPTADAMANVPADFYRTEIRAGYRGAYFAELAEKVAAGKLDPESWLNSALPTAELKKEMKNVKGVGDYAAENLLKLVGNYEGLALDSWVRARFYEKHNGKNVCEDRQIRAFYEKFGVWRGLAAWCDVTEKRF